MARRFTVIKERVVEMAALHAAHVAARHLLFRIENFPEDAAYALLAAEELHDFSLLGDWDPLAILKEEATFGRKRDETAAEAVRLLTGVIAAQEASDAA